MIYSDPKYSRYRNSYKFVVKLPFSTGGLQRSFCQKVKGIYAALRRFIKRDRVGGYIPYAIIQPEIRDNAEAKVVCFNGKAEFLEKIKKSKSGRSPFGNVSERTLFDFAEHVISCLTRSCPAICTKQILRVDIFGFKDYPGEFICNEVEGYEAQKCGTGSCAGVREAGRFRKVVTYWEEVLTQLIDYYLATHCRQET
jgi:hypothetical protein